MDYCVWNLISQKEYENRQEIFTALELEVKILHRWEEIESVDIRKSIYQ